MLLKNLKSIWHLDLKSLHCRVALEIFLVFVSPEEKGFISLKSCLVSLKQPICLAKRYYCFPQTFLLLQIYKSFLQESPYWLGRNISLSFFFFFPLYVRQHRFIVFARLFKNRRIFPKII